MGKNKDIWTEDLLVLPEDLLVLPANQSRSRVQNMLADQEFSRHVQWITKQPEGEGNERKELS